MFFWNTTVLVFASCFIMVLIYFPDLGVNRLSSHMVPRPPKFYSTMPQWFVKKSSEVGAMQEIHVLSICAHFARNVYADELFITNQSCSCENCKELVKPTRCKTVGTRADFAWVKILTECISRSKSMSQIDHNNCAFEKSIIRLAMADNSRDDIESSWRDRGDRHTHGPAATQTLYWATCVI